MEMLEAREKRARRQQELLARHGGTLVSFTMNIAGPVKDSALIRRGFRMGVRDLEQLLAVEKIICRHREERQAHTGCEAFWVLDAPAAQVKQLTEQLEEAAPLGRLYDMDVLCAGGEKLQRAQPRRCLLCGQVAQVCARSRAHSVAQLQARTCQLLEQAVLDDDSRFAARMVQQALLYEVAVTPKPGLVDRQSNGSHRDMDIFTFQRSAAALQPYWEQCVRIGRETRDRPPTETLARLRFPGKQAEGWMLAATGGVNTHKGAVFSLGLLCGALGRLDREQWRDSDRVLALCGEMAAQLLEDFAQPQDTAGQRLYREHGITGIRGQAAAGYPAVRHIALPRLRAGLERGLCLNDAACAALLALIANTVDTNMIRRGGLQRQAEVAAEIAALLEREPFPGRRTLERLDARFVEEDLSPGGCADLLAMALLLYFLAEET